MSHYVKFNETDVAQMAQAYTSGESASSLAKRYGCQPGTVIGTLRRAGIVTRSKRQAFAALGEEKRSAMTAAAHAAKRGKPEKEESKVARAITVETNSTVNALEQRFINWLTEVSPGIKFTPQKAVGPYNVDVALTEYRVAVEIFGGNWHSTGNHARRYRTRIEYLLGAKWTPLVVWVTTRQPLTRAAADYAVSLCKVLSAEHPAVSEEHVIWGTGELIPASHRDPVTGACKPGAHSRL